MTVCRVSKTVYYELKSNSFRVLSVTAIDIEKKNTN